MLPKQETIFFWLAVMVGGVLVPIGARAGTWETMHPQTFPPTIEAAILQCERSAKLSSHDGLTPKHCKQLKTMLANGQCQSVLVADGLTYTYLNYKRVGETPRIERSVTKKLGGNHPVLRCLLGDNVTADWFNQPKVGCNNLGFVLPPTRSAVLNEPECRLVPVELASTFTPGVTYDIASVHVHDAYCGHSVSVDGFSVNVPGSISHNTALVRVCK